MTLRVTINFSGESLKNFDRSFLSKDINFIAGIDEAGRGPLAGPVVAAAVIFDNDTVIEGINDSKKLTEKKREELFKIIKEKSLSYAVGIVDEKSIDEINILNAALQAMKIAAEELNPKPDLILIDGNKNFKSNFPTKTIVKGDAKSFAIAAASILAKVTRDRIMREAAENHPEYLWHKNKGYGTKQHIEAIHKFGFTDYHRKSFLSKILSSI
ncbi:MAG: ribonuclease HII [Ignavibacteria bacterium GWB2_35_6b]|nr:MAG: ribonuclease HII [Ignavibacteria bacterium GWB2_35_6b]